MPILIEKKPRLRSPAYPTIDLGAAVERAREISNFANLTAVTVSNVLIHWGYTAESSNGMKIVAALGYYGLIDDSSTGQRRKIRLNERAHRILNDHEESPARHDALGQAALSPTIYADLWSNYAEHGPDAELRTYLIFERKFNTNAVDGIIADYRKTVAYAKLGASAKIELASELSAATVIPLPSDTLTQPPPALKQAGVMNQDTFTIGEGIAVLQWPAQLSTESAKDLEDWLALVVRKMKRNTTAQTSTLLAENAPDGSTSTD